MPYMERYPVPERPVHPLIRGLIDHLPDPDAAWSPSERTAWIAAAVSIFDLLYPPADPPNATRDRGGGG